MNKVYIERPLAQEMMASYPELHVYADHLKISNRIEIPFEAMTAAQIDALCAIYQQRGENPTKIGMLRALQDTLNLKAEHTVYAAGHFETFLTDLIDYLSHGLERGWIFRLDGAGTLKPFVVSQIDFTPTSGEDNARLILELKANSCGKLNKKMVVFGEREIVGKSLPEIMIAKGYLRETPLLLAAHDADVETFFDWRNQFGKQFCATGTGFYAEDPTATHRDRDFARKNAVVLARGESKARLVNDETILTERDLTLDASGQVLTKMIKRMDRESGLSRETESQIERQNEALKAGLFTQVPVHAYIFVFHLELHHHLWVHVSNMSPYAYNPELKDKLILPPEHVGLIDILTSEMGVLMDDIVQGKSGGTTVLCSGPAGVGKTLTAEVYSEIIRRPLYRVHSGQLGLNVAEMEKTLKDVLIRAQRWGAVMLIDEADVYIKRRDDNLAMNAVVGVFLRVLEYFNGLLFLTTNRTHDIDEAIISRCIAMIRYAPPSKEERSQIWDVMATQFGLQLEQGQTLALAEKFPQATGRDIKGLAKLVSKYCAYKDVAPTMDAFDHCAIFRGLDMGKSAP